MYSPKKKDHFWNSIDAESCFSFLNRQQITWHMYGPFNPLNPKNDNNPFSPNNNHQYKRF